MRKKQNTKFITPDILKGAVKGAFIKLNPRYMMKNPVMFVVEIGFFITLLLSFFPGLFGDGDAGSLRIYDIIVCVILFITVLFANFAEAVAEGRGKAQADALRASRRDVMAARIPDAGKKDEIELVKSTQLKKGDLEVVHRVSAGQGGADHIGGDPHGDRQHHHALDDDKDGLHLKIAVRVLFRHGLVKQRRQKEQQRNENQLRHIVHRVGEGGMGTAVYGKNKFCNGKQESRKKGHH